MRRLIRTIACSTIALWAAAASAGQTNPPAASDPAPAATPAPAPAAPPPPAPPAQNPGTPATVLDTQDYETLLGKSVRAANGDDLGRIIDIVVDKDGKPRAAIIDFGGFLGVGSRKIAVEWRALKFNADGKLGALTLQLNRNQVRVSPEYKSGEPIVVLGPSNPGNAADADPAALERAAQEKAAQEKALLERAVQERAAQEKAAAEKAAQERANQDKASQEKAAQPEIKPEK
ncbi:PRC-barrel domain-containing protein [Methylobacterium organophilum]|uniref:PRC-barrel domain-containing protein n=1 Tax=Methylobacterium organophilum TaxID=410 RepID=A0ABQ4TDX8_METOR|nr:PRC-barrel domain-containing protein [Methylobacterium organophilum]GJE28237.1 hypothetical protein LKMONMHP_3104 [Methylobacterium organophilum]